MTGNEVTHPRSASWAGLAALLAAAAAMGLWLWRAHGASVLLLSAVGLLTLTVALGVYWLDRIRGARRLRSALDAYAERELARAEGRRPAVAGKRLRARQRLKVAP
jgi:hypothetical protein